MSKKLIFIGPPGAGKTTLKKIFFQGENSNKLLEYALEPTYGEESLIFRLSELNKELGIFDLAGQENDRWFSEDKAIFQDAKIILVILDISDGFEEIVDFIRKVIKLRNNTSSTSKVIVFIHKIDLATPFQIQKIKSTLKKNLGRINFLQFYFTSIKRPYFAKTFSFFLDILKACLREGDKTSLISDSETLRYILEAVILIRDEILISRDELRERLEISNNSLDNIISHLINKKHITYELESGKQLFSLTNIGKRKIENLIDKISLKHIIGDTKIKVAKPIQQKYEDSQIIGFFIADIDGKTFLRVETFEGALNRYIANQDESQPSENENFDIELIPMFISALEKFSHELNIQNLSGFNLKGENLKMEIFNINDYTVTFFVNPLVKLRVLEKDLKNYFTEFFKKYQEDLELFESSGATSNKNIYNNAKIWLQNLNKKYNKFILNHKILDDNQIQKVYNEIDAIQENVSIKTSIMLKRLKKIKVNLVKAILDEEKEDIRKIIEKINQIKIEYSIV